MRAVAASDEREILPGAGAPRTFVREIPFLDRRELFLESVEPAVIEVEHRIVGEHACDEQVARISRRRWHHDAETGDVREPGLKRLRVLRSLLPATVDDRTDCY